MLLTKTFLTPLTLLLSLFLSLSAQSQVKVTLNKVKQQYAVGEIAQFRITSNTAGNGNYEILFDSRESNSVIQRGTFSFTANKLDTTVQFTLPFAGMVFFRALQNAIQSDIVATFDPLSIQPIESEPTDFDAFWTAQKALLAVVPINPVLTQYSLLPNGSRVFFIQLDQVDNRKVQGYLVVPAGSGRFPAVVMLPPFGDAPILPDPFLMTDFAERCKSIVFYVSVHNTAPNVTDVNAYKPNDLLRNDGFYNRYMIFAGLRAIDYLATRTDFNGSLGIMGNSQGAGLAMSVAGIDSRVSACFAAAPASSEQQGVRFGRASGFPRYVRQARDLNIDTNVVERTSKYHDVIYFAKRITKPLLMLTGYKDDVTPSATHFAAFNQYRGKGVVCHLREIAHNYTDEFWSGRYAFFNQHLTGFENPFGFKKSFDLDAGADRTKSGDTIQLATTLRLDGIPNSAIPLKWEKVEGSGTVTFTNLNSRLTAARFSQSGTYVLRVSADDDYRINDSNEAKYYTMVDFVTVTVRGVGTKEFSTDKFSVFPTPSVSLTTVRWDAATQCQSARLLDLSGKVLANFVLNSGQTELQLNLSNYLNGLYFLEIKTNKNELTTMKLIKN